MLISSVLKKSTISNGEFWSCSKLYTYWKSVFPCFSEAFGNLGVTSSSSLPNKFVKMVVLFVIVIAKKLILRVWKMDSVPTYDLLLREMAPHTWRDRGRV